MMQSGQIISSLLSIKFEPVQKMMQWNQIIASLFSNMFEPVQEVNHFYDNIHVGKCWVKSPHKIPMEWNFISFTFISLLSRELQYHDQNSRQLLVLLQHLIHSKIDWHIYDQWEFHHHKWAGLGWPGLGWPGLARAGLGWPGQMVIASLFSMLTRHLQDFFFQNFSKSSRDKGLLRTASLRLKIFQITILTLKLKFPAKNSKEIWQMQHTFWIKATFN